MREPEPGDLEIQYSASPEAREVIGSMGRTEDVRFSPNRKRLAVATFDNNRIAVYDVEVAGSVGARTVVLPRATEFTSSYLNQPHGLDFVDNETLVVANRAGDVAIFRLPSESVAGGRHELRLLNMLRAGESQDVMFPGSVAVTRTEQHRHELLVCNNFVSRVTRHALDSSADCAVRSSEVLLRKWLDVPDSISVSRDRRWLAVSNHNTHSVLLYENAPSLHEDADPDGVLRCVQFPHGVRFSADGRHLLVADAGSPYVHVFAGDRLGWRGVRNPVTSFRAMDESLFLAGHEYMDEGGVKGIDIDHATNVLVTTSAHQPLAFFDLDAVLRQVQDDRPWLQSGGNASIGAAGTTGGYSDHDARSGRQREQQAIELGAELALMAEARKVAAERDAARRVLDNLRRSPWWRLHERIVAVPGVHQFLRFLVTR